MLNNIEVPKKAKNTRRNILLVLSFLLAVIGVVLISGTIFVPQTVEKVYGNTKTVIQHQVQVIQQAVVPEQLATVTLGGLGGKAELDWCDGTFIEMESYRIPGVPPVYAAHNSCGGDIILGWTVGQHIQITNTGHIYEIVEERYTTKWSQIDSLVGMQGDLVLQSCYYGENKMRFLGLKEIPGK